MTDVSTKDWFYDSIKFVLERGLMVGTSDSSFGPNLNTSRAMIVTILHRLEGTPEAGGGGFNDVAAGNWYSEATGWAAENSIISGYSNGRFGPNDNITREQLCVILYNYAKFKGYIDDINDQDKGADSKMSAVLDKFSDNGNVSSWAVEPMKWAVEAGLIMGVNDDKLDPAGTATRAQLAAILQRFIGTFIPAADKE